jgi:hypothetical protein
MIPLALGFPGHGLEGSLGKEFGFHLHLRDHNFKAIGGVGKREVALELQMVLIDLCQFPLPLI